MFLETSEKSLNHARGNYAGIHGLPTMEFVVAFAKNMNTVPEKTKLYMEGTNKDPIIGRFDNPAKDDFMTLQVVHNQKTALYGPAFVLCGGSVVGDSSAEQRGPKRVPVKAASSRVIYSTPQPRTPFGAPCPAHTCAIKCAKWQRRVCILGPRR